MKTLTFDDAYKQLEIIVTEIEADHVPLDDLAKKVKQAKTLIKYCEDKLRAIELELVDDSNKN